MVSRTDQGTLSSAAHHQTAHAGAGRVDSSLAELTLKHGAVMAEIKQDLPTLKHQVTKINGEQVRLYEHLTSPESDDELGENIEQLEGALGDREATTVREEWRDLPNSQSAAHMRAVMGSSYPERASSRELVEKYLGVGGKCYWSRGLQMREGFASQRMALKLDEDYLSAMSQALDAERARPDKAAFYHGADAAGCFLYDVITKFRTQMNLMTSDDRTIFRGSDLLFADFANLKDFYEFYRMKRLEKTKLPYIDYTDNYKDMGLSVNQYLFGTDDDALSAYMGATYSYFNMAISQPGTNHKEVFESCMASFGIQANYEDYEPIFEKYTKVNCKLYQIFIDPQVVDNVAYVSKSGGFTVTVSPGAEEDYGFVNNMKAMRGDVRDLEGKSEDRDYTTNFNSLQGRIFLKPEILHDPRFVQVRTYWRHAMEPTVEQEYRDALSAQVSKDLARWLESGRAPEPDTLHTPSRLRTLYQQIAPLDSLPDKGVGSA